MRMTSGHQRWSVHSVWVTDDVLARTHQGRPTMFMNTGDAAKRGIKDGDLVHVRNDFDDFKIHVKLTSAARSQDAEHSWSRAVDEPHGRHQQPSPQPGPLP